MDLRPQHSFATRSGEQQEGAVAFRFLSSEPLPIFDPVEDARAWCAASAPDETTTDEDDESRIESSWHHRALLDDKGEHVTRRAFVSRRRINLRSRNNEAWMAAWTRNWWHNMKQCASFARAVSAVCDLSAVEYSHMVERRATQICTPSARHAVMEHGGVLHDILDWIEEGVRMHNECRHVPDYMLLATRDFSPHRDAWIRHVKGSREKLTELKAAVDDLLNEVSEKVSAFRAEDSGSHSSYSDYSDDECSSSGGASD